MTENTQNPAATNPSSPDTSALEPAFTGWKMYNHIHFIIDNLPLSTYEQAIQDKFQDINQRCADMCANPALMQVPAICSRNSALMNLETAVGIIEPLGEQLQASPCLQVASYAQFIINPCKDLEKVYSS